MEDITLLIYGPFTAFCVGCSVITCIRRRELVGVGSFVTEGNDFFLSSRWMERKILVPYGVYNVTCTSIYTSTDKKKFVSGWNVAGEP